MSFNVKNISKDVIFKKAMSLEHSIIDLRSHGAFSSHIAGAAPKFDDQRDRILFESI